LAGNSKDQRSFQLLSLKVTDGGRCEPLTIGFVNPVFRRDLADNSKDQRSFQLLSLKVTDGGRCKPLTIGFVNPVFRRDRWFYLFSFRWYYVWEDCIPASLTGDRDIPRP